MKIKIKKYKLIENLEFSIPAEITGGNGLGKSTILEAISFALTGKDMGGNEFKQVYDNREDLHDAVADVSFFDSYGNEFQRVVHPIFQTNRAGIEEIKIKRSTECRKNGIPVSDFSNEFVDFYKFGTDYFFNQKEDLQRSIFIDILKNKLPDFDVNSASLKLKEIKRSQKIEVDLVKNLQEAQKNTMDVPTPTIPGDLMAKNEQYLKLINSADPKVAAEINKRNNEAMASYFETKSQLNRGKELIENQISHFKSNLVFEEKKLIDAGGAVFEPQKVTDTDPLKKLVARLVFEMDKLEYFEKLESYAAMYFSKNPILVENKIKIEDLMNQKFSFVETENSGDCPLSNEFCETAKLHSEKVQKINFEAGKNEQIALIKAQNRAILEKEMMQINSEYLAAKSDLQEAERKFNNAIEANKKIESDNELLKTAFYDDQKKLTDEIKNKIKTFNTELQKLSTQLTQKEAEISALTEPTPEKLPEASIISDELKQAYELVKNLQIEINKAQGVNENNTRLIAERAAQIKEKQANLLKIIEQINDLQTAISQYFSNLSEIVKTEFAGDIAIDVDILEYVISRDEYKDIFKITANNKVFPYECNGALQNNVKTQILSNFQRLKEYKGITILDNAEANTSQPINVNGLNAVIAYATFDEKLTIK